MASLTSTSGGKIPVDSTETAQRRKSAQPLGSFSQHLAPAFIFLVFLTPLLQARSVWPGITFASRKHKHTESQSNTKSQPWWLFTGTRMPMMGSGGRQRPSSTCWPVSGCLQRAQQSTMLCGRQGTYRCNGFALSPGARDFSDPHVGKLLC